MQEGRKSMNKQKDDKIRSAVRDNYSRIALSGGTGCCRSNSSCCGKPDDITASEISMGLGYTKDDLFAAPEGANIGLGCGNPQAIASLKTGETVIDLGSGGGFDSFLAARAVGEQGLIIGVDMTPEMISKSLTNAAKAGFTNVDFRLGELEYLPVADGIADVIISNCVINLSPDKERVFSEAFRVLKPGGRIAISDVVATKEMPQDIREDIRFYAGCVGGAATIEEIQSIMQKAGFDQIRIELKPESRMFIRDWIPGSNIEDYVLSATIEAVKPL